MGRTLGKKETVRLFFEGTICPDCCCFVFGKNGCIDKNEFLDFFRHCMEYFATNASPSVRRIHKHNYHQMYKDFVVDTFGPCKKHLNRREFWFVADLVWSKFYVEKSFTESQTEM